MRLGWLLGAALVTTAVMPPLTGPAAPATGCARSAAPLSALGLRPTAQTSTDGVAMVVWSGHVASWDGIPLDVDVTLPAGAACGLPLVAFGHGWGESKAAWERDSQTTSDPNASQWNSTWFASRGDAVLTFSMRGWAGSCGPAASPTGTPVGLPAACTMGGRQYWVHLDDLRYEIRDAQWLIGRLVDTGAVDPNRVVATGGSYGGGQTDLLALLNDRVMCGGAAALPPDPCAATPGGHTVPWRSPAGVPLHIAAAVPEYTWASLVNALVPNGRATDQPAAAVLDQSGLITPVGVPIESYIDGLYADAYTPPAVENGFLQPPTSTDQTADLPLWFASIQAGVNTVSAALPGTGAIVTQALNELADYKSPLTPLVTPDARVPLFQVQGLTDPLFRPVEALLLRDRLLAASPGYPVTTELADVGHSYAANAPDDWARINTDANAFVDHALHGTGPTTAPDVVAILTRCRPALHQPLTAYTAPSWAALARGSLDLTSPAGGTTTNAAVGELGVKTDPIVNGGAPVSLVTTGKGCPLLPAEIDDPGTVSWKWTVARTVTLLGSPLVRANVSRTGPDAELDGRLWDIAPDGSEALMGRGTYRLSGSAASGPVTFQLSANGWRLPAGDVVKLELVGADAPYFQPDAIPSVVTIAGVTLHLPIARPTAVTVEPPAAVAAAPGPARLPATGPPGPLIPITGAAALAGAVIVVSRRRRSSL